MRQITNYPDNCKDCSEYGSDFCDECLKEMKKELKKKNNK